MGSLCMLGHRWLQLLQAVLPRLSASEECSGQLDSW